MSQKEDLENKLQARLDEYAANIDGLKALADRAGADAQLEYYKQIESLRMNQEAAKTKFDEFISQRVMAHGKTLRMELKAHGTI